MNYCLFNGYVIEKRAFTRNKENNEYMFDFFLSVTNDDGIARGIPFRAYGDAALVLYSKIQVGYYMEISSKYYRIDNITNYFVVKDAMYKAPKSESQYYVKASAILEMYNPNDVIEKLKKGKKNG